MEKELPPLNQATPTLTGKPARDFLKRMRDVNKNAEEFRKSPEYDSWYKEKENWLNKILSKAKL